jgi:hypothetical protein
VLSVREGFGRVPSPAPGGGPSDQPRPEAMSRPGAAGESVAPARRAMSQGEGYVAADHRNAELRLELVDYVERAQVGAGQEHHVDIVPAVDRPRRVGDLGRV